MTSWRLLPNCVPPFLFCTLVKNSSRPFWLFTSIQFTTSFMYLNFQYYLWPVHVMNSNVWKQTHLHVGSWLLKTNFLQERGVWPRGSNFRSTWFNWERIRGRPFKLDPFVIRLKRDKINFDVWFIGWDLTWALFLYMLHYSPTTNLDPSICYSKMNYIFKTGILL